MFVTDDMMQVTRPALDGGDQPVVDDVVPPLHPVDAADELLAILARIDQLQAHATAALAALNNATGWRRGGYTSATAFLKHRAAFSSGRAMRLVYNANTLPDMPLTMAAYQQGRLSTDSVEILVAAYSFNPDAYLREEATLVDLATQLPFVAELRRLLEYWKQRIDPETVESHQDMINSLRGIRIKRDDGIGRAYIALPEAEFDAWLHHIDPGPPQPADTRSLTQRRADRLIETINTTTKRQLLIHVTTQPHQAATQTTQTATQPHQAATQTRQPDSPRVLVRGETEYGTTLTPATLERYACNATICRIIFSPDSEILDLGRTQRLFSPAQRRAITARDRHCRFPGCDRPPRWCDIHHIKHWLHGGETNIANGILLCRFHHTLTHETGWTITGTPQHLTTHNDLGHYYTTTPTQPTRGP